MSAPSPPPPRSGLGPPPSLDGLSALLSENSSPSKGTIPSPVPTTPVTSKTATNSHAVPQSPSGSAMLSPNHPYNLRKQAKTQLDPSFSVKSYIGAANALLEKARSSDAQGQAEQAFVNYLKAADVAANIPKHADWPKTVEQRGPAYFRYQDFMKNVPSIIQRGQRLEELLKAREEARAEEAKNALREEQQQNSMSRAENDLDGEKGGTDAVTDETSAQIDALASRLSVLRGPSSRIGPGQKRMTIAGGVPMSLSQSAETTRDTDSSDVSASQSPDLLRLQNHSSLGRASPQLERSGFAGITDNGPSLGPDMRPTQGFSSASDFDQTYPTLDEFESKQVQPDFPARPLPVPPNLSSQETRPPVPTPPRREIAVESLFPILHPGFDTVNDPQTGTRMVRRKAPRVLLIDTRPRTDWQRVRIKGVDSVCVESTGTRNGVSCEGITSLLRTNGTQSEQQHFASRRSYDLLVLCDYDGRTVNSGGLDNLAKCLVEDDSQRTGDRLPALLTGGIERWARKVGEAGLQGDEARLEALSPPRSEQSNTFDSDLRSKRQAIYMSSPPASLIPGSKSGVQSMQNGRGPSSAYTGSGLDGVDVSLPPRTYQGSGNASTGLQSSQYARQPHIPTYSGNNANLSSTGAISRTSTGTFDYPQLNGQLSPKRPTFDSGYAAPTVPPAAAATSGLGMRSPSLEQAGRTQSMDLTRRPPIPSPYTGPPLSSASIPRPLQTASYRHAVPRNDQNIRIGLTGLKNMGNSCYMNSTLQCLNATIPLARFLLDGSYKKAINKVNPLGTQGALAEAFAQLIRVMWSEQYTFVSPVTFRDAIARFAPAFRGYEQHDAQEFLSFLLDGLHEDLNYVKQKPPPVEMTPQREQELEMLPQQVASVKEWAIYRERNDSLIVDWFQGQFRNKLTCLTCGKTSTTYNAFLYLSLPIPPTPRGSDRVTLAQCLDAFTRDEILDKADAWHCPRCNKPRRATKKLTISRLPQVLLIHLKRFSFKGPFTDKIKTNVTFPTSNLDLTNYMPPPLPPGAVPEGMPISSSQQPPYVYDLFGATHHFGSLSGGHYTATIRTQGENGEPQWMYCDDSRVTRADDREIHSPSSYILWWNRKGR